MEQWNTIISTPYLMLLVDVERECRVNPMGSGYFGTMSRSASGESCLMWADMGSTYGPQMPEVNIKDSRNYCRNILGLSAWSQPSCLVATTVASSATEIRLAQCDIVYCGQWNNHWLISDVIVSRLTKDISCDSRHLILSKLLMNNSALFRIWQIRKHWT